MQARVTTFHNVVKLYESVLWGVIEQLGAMEIGAVLERLISGFNSTEKLMSKNTAGGTVGMEINVLRFYNPAQVQNSLHKYIT